MNTNKFIVGGIIGGVANFLLGWLVWGMLLMNFMKEHTTEIGKTVMRPDDQMVWGTLIAANLLMGFLFSFILNKAGTMSASSGASTGAVVGLLTSAAINCFNYSFMDMSDMTAMGVDVAASTVVSAIVGGIIGWYLGMGKKAAA